MGQRGPLKWFALLGTTFLVGGVVGARAAAMASRVFLQWTYVVYLVALGSLVIARPSHRNGEGLSGRFDSPVSSVALTVVGAFAGFSSGFLGIGGGLAMTVGLTAWLKVPNVRRRWSASSCWRRP
jgi:uncharacterized protein